jgi:hypothetical protein
MLSPAPGATTGIGPISIYSLGLGYHIDPVLFKDIRIVGHDGSNRGWKSTFLAVPAEGKGIAVLTNAERGGALNERLECLWVEWATGGTIPTCLTMQLPRDIALAAGIWLMVSSVVVGRRVVRSRRASPPANSPGTTTATPGPTHYESVLCP